MALFLSPCYRKHECLLCFLCNFSREPYISFCQFLLSYKTSLLTHYLPGPPDLSEELPSVDLDVLNHVNSDCFPESWVFDCCSGGINL